MWDAQYRGRAYICGGQGDTGEEEDSYPIGVQLGSQGEYIEVLQVAGTVY